MGNVNKSGYIVGHSCEILLEVLCYLRLLFALLDYGGALVLLD